MESNKYKFRKVLIIDDEFIDTYIIKHLMQSHNFADEYMLIDSSLDAYDYISEELIGDGKAPEIIILDLNMPLYNGFELLEKIDAQVNMHQLSTKVYILSSSDYIVDINKAKAFHSVAGYIIKPFTEEKLKEIV